MTTQYAWPWSAPTDHKMKLAGDWPRITIVTPNYNGAQYIEATLRSVICQGYPNLQYIVVDGASTDNSMEIINRYKDHIDHIICEPDKGHADAINKGFARADGDILAWLNSDDLYHSWSLQTVAEIFRKFPEVRWIEGTPALWDPQGRLYAGNNDRSFTVYDYLLGRYEFIQQESTFWRRDLWEQAGGRMNTDYRLMIDGELWARFFLHAKLHRVATHFLGGFRQHQTNRSLNRKLVVEEMERAIETLRTQVSPHIRERAARIKRAQGISALLPVKSARELVLKQLAGRDLPELAYDVVRYNAGDWSLERWPWK